MAEHQLVELGVTGSSPADHPKTVVGDVCTYSLTDKAIVFGTIDRGSIPLRCAKSSGEVSNVSFRLKRGAKFGVPSIRS